MQEALYSLLQMAKTSAALKRLSEARLPFISVMTDPTTGGVSASLAMLGDINIGEPKALIGFAGPRVIQQTVRETLPEGFQRSEFLLEHGALDMIVDRREMRDRIGAMLRLLTGKEPASGLSSPGPSCGRSRSGSPTKNGCTRSRSISGWSASAGSRAAPLDASPRFRSSPSRAPTARVRWPPTARRFSPPPASGRHFHLAASRDYRERIRVQERWASADSLARAFDRIEQRLHAGALAG